MASGQPVMGGEHRKSNYDLHSNTTLAKNNKQSDQASNGFSKKDKYNNNGKNGG